MSKDVLIQENQALRNLNLSYLKQIERLKGELQVEKKKNENMQLLLKGSDDLANKVIHLETENFNLQRDLKRTKKQYISASRKIQRQQDRLSLLERAT